MSGKAPEMAGLSDFWRTDGTLGRGSYLALGLVLCAVKYNLDRLLAGAGFGRPWSAFSYLSPAPQGSVVEQSPDDFRFFAAMVALAIPFIGCGVALTLRRLRDAALPSWLVVLFFLPVVNLIFFAVLCVVPGRPRPGERPPSLLARYVPESAAGSAAVAIALVVPVGAGAAFAGVELLGNYGWGLFVGLPFALGLAAVLLYSVHRRRSFWECVLAANLAVGFVGLVLLALAVEGILCLAMAAPLALGLATLGGIVGWAIQDRAWGAQDATLLVVLLAAPVLMGAESRLQEAPPLLAVTTTVDVAAPPERVWTNVVAFSDLPRPAEWLFRTGIAYPVRARIQGRVRYCEFSTGPFVEPIEVWDPPRRLGFSVQSQPPPMQEWSLGPGVHPPHLDGFLTSERGEFRLEPLPDGGTRLHGTTWYRHRLWPSPYWQVWSDAIIHGIHGRVLRHVKALSEDS